MSSSSNMSGIENDYLRFRNKTCGCGTRAAVRISESERNPGRLFYGCPKGKNDKEKCSYWREWCNPVGYHQPMPNVAEDEERVNEVNLKKINARLEVIQVAVDKFKIRVTVFMFIISLALIILLLK